MDWQGDNPYYLVIHTVTGGTVIDLDERGWASHYAELMRAPGMWTLQGKDGQGSSLVLTVGEGSSPTTPLAT